MSGVQIHVAFDVLAWLAAGLAALWLSRMERIPFPAVTTDMSYLATLMLGAAAGAYVFGSINLWLSGQHGIGRSIEGAVFGGIAAIEVYKRVAGIRVRTGARFALPFAIGVAVGRIGCFLAGIEDFTHGTPTSVPWAHDFGDGVPRHPVQLYESAAMAAFAIVYVLCARRRVAFVIDNGFYLAAGFYGLQRFVWEFFKPYGPLIGPFTLFHLLSAAIVVYAAAMIVTAPTSRAAHEHAVA
jgi:phosphatidylglycerol---prolipoprotein diacylglyceryl transferase